MNSYNQTVSGINLHIISVMKIELYELDGAWKWNVNGQCELIAIQKYKYFLINQYSIQQN